MRLSARHLAIATVLCTGALGGGWLLRSVSWSTTPSAAPAAAYTLLDGQTGNLHQLRGQVVLVNFWATSCSICVAEMPALAATFEAYRSRGFQTLAVALQDDPPALVAIFAEQKRLPFGVVIDNTGAVARSFAGSLGGVPGTPTTFLINKRGEIVKRYLGKPDFVALRLLVEQLLAEA